MPLRATWLLTSVALFFLAEASWGLTAYPFELQTSTELATEGYLGLSWQPASGSADDRRISLQVATSPNFESIFASYNLVQQQQVSLSGLADGDYFARLLDHTQTPVSNVASFRVQHRDLAAAWLLFALGAALFSLLLGILLNLQKRARQNGYSNNNGKLRDSN